MCEEENKQLDSDILRALLKPDRIIVRTNGGR